MSYVFADVEKKAEAYSQAYGKLAEVCHEIEKAVSDVRRSKVSLIVRLARRAAETKEALREIVSLAPELFGKPKTVVLQGIKVGYQKARGELRIEDPERTVKLIRQHLPNQADVLLDIKVTPRKAALADLPALTLKKIGVEIAETGDEVVVRPMAGDVEKFAAALLREAEDTAY